jgi:hypothetical protein
MDLDDLTIEREKREQPRRSDWEARLLGCAWFALTLAILVLVHYLEGL